MEISRALYLSTTAAKSFHPGSKGADPGVPVLKRLSAVVNRRAKDKKDKFLDGPLLVAFCLALIEVRRVVTAHKACA